MADGGVRDNVDSHQRDTHRFAARGCPHQSRSHVKEAEKQRDIWRWIPEEKTTNPPSFWRRALFSSSSFPSLSFFFFFWCEGVFERLEQFVHPAFQGWLIWLKQCLNNQGAEKTLNSFHKKATRCFCLSFTESFYLSSVVRTHTAMQISNRWGRRGLYTKTTSFTATQQQHTVIHFITKS